MSESTIRAVLRLGALFLMLYALVQVTGTLVATMGAQVQMGEVGGAVTRMAGWAVAAHLATFAWGLALYIASAALARRVAE